MIGDTGCRAPAAATWLWDDKFKKKEDKRRNVVISQMREGLSIKKQDKMHH